MITDLSSFHEPVSDLLGGSLWEIDWESNQLSQEQLDFFEEQGYLTGIRILSEEQVDELREQLDDLMNPDYPGNKLFHELYSNESTDPSRVLFHALGAWRIKPGFHDILWHPKFTTAASQLLNGSVRFWHDQLFCKPAKHGGVVAWHQDYSYWTRTEPMAHLTCWIGLDDSTVENGCLHYIPGSHRWDLLPITGLAGDMEAINEVLTPEQREQFKPVPMELKKGEASFHHPLMIHGSFASTSERPRRATVLNVFRDGTRSATEEPLMKDIPPIPPGEKIEGQFFPLLFDATAMSAV